jgi:hypothetical protein
MSSSKKLTRKGTLLQVFVRVYGPEIHSGMLVFTTQLWFFKLGPLPLPRFKPPPPPFPCVFWYTEYTYIQCVRGWGVWGSGPQADKHLPQSPFTGQFC